VAWNLALDPGPTFLDPRNALLRLLRPLDMQLVSWPRASISGTITIAGRRHAVAPAGALVSHYWGRRLPPTWHWVSANRFEGDSAALEAMVLRTHLWGGPQVTAGYFFLERAGRRQLVVAPHGGQVTFESEGDTHTLTARPFRAPAITVHLCAPPAAYNDLGEGIHQTLLATCTLHDGLTARATCGLEHRR
jgi:hypothetical protein